MMLGFLLARFGVGVVVLEKHPDFFRDFRGDTVHPSTLEVMCELGPHQPRVSGHIGGEDRGKAAFDRLLHGLPSAGRS